jgi:TRAP transporter TAXI family solute receptor
MLGFGRIKKDTRQGARGRLWTGLGLAAIIGFSILAVIYGTSLFTKPDQTVIRIGVGPKASEARSLIEAIAEVAARHIKRFKFVLVETAGSRENIQLLEDRKIDLATAQSDAITRPHLRLVANLYPDLYQLLARDDAGIKSVPDLKGKRIAVSGVRTGQFRSFWLLIGHYNVPPESLQAFPMAPQQAEQALKQGKVDALFRVRAPRNRRIKWLIEGTRLSLVPIDQAEAMKLRRPALFAATIPKGAYKGQPPEPAQPLPTVGTKRILLARAGVPDSVIRALTGILFERRRELMLLTPLAGFIEQPNLGASTPLPLHAGAASFFDREKPSFFEEKAEFFAFLVSLVAVLGSILIWFTRRWAENQKGRIDDYNLDLIKICDRARASTDPSIIAQCKDELAVMLAKVVDDLDYDRVNARGFHFFAFTWEAVNNAIANHEQTIGKAKSQDRQRSAKPRVKV